MALIMKTLIVYASVHHQNTEKVAKVMAEELGADLVPIGQARPSTLTAYDLIGFGSGVYGKKFHKTLIQFVEALPAVTGKRAFIFSTSGGGEIPVSYTHLRAHETRHDLVCRLLLEKKKERKKTHNRS